MTQHRPRTFAVLVTIVMLLVIPISAFALTEKQEKALETAVDAMFGGPKKEQFKVINHKFNFEWEVVTTEIGPREETVGKFTHFLTWSFDDVVRFTIVFENGELEGYEMKIEDRGWTEILDLATAATSFVPKALLDEVGIDFNAGFKEFNAFLKAASDGSWEQEAQIIVLNVAKRLYEGSSNPPPPPGGGGGGNPPGGPPKKQQ
jgi:hypothetical protein